MATSLRDINRDQRAARSVNISMANCRGSRSTTADIAALTLFSNENRGLENVRVRTPRGRPWMPGTFPSYTAQKSPAPTWIGDRGARMR
jgi:hypothetical protein